MDAEDRVIDIPHCPECHCKLFKTVHYLLKSSEWLHECLGCGNEYQPSDSLMIDKFHYGESKSGK